MALNRTIRFKNNKETADTWVSHTIPPGSYYEIPNETELKDWQDNSKALADVASGDLKVGDGTQYFNDVNYAWNVWVIGQTQSFNTFGQLKTEISQTSKYRLIEFRSGQSLPKGTAQAETVQCTANTSGVLNNKYFLKYTPENDNDDYCFWFNSSNAGTAPNLYGFTNVPVAITDGDNAITVATALKNAADAISSLTATVSGDTLTINNTETGTTSSMEDGPSSASASTGFTFDVLTVGGGFTTVYQYLGSGCLWGLWLDLSSDDVDLEVIIDDSEYIIPQIDLDHIVSLAALSNTSGLNLISLGSSNFAFNANEKICFNSSVKINLKTCDEALGGNKVLNRGYIVLVKGA